MKKPLLIRCDFQGDTFCALWLDGGGDYLLGWVVGLPKTSDGTPAASSKLRYRDRAQAAESYDSKRAELAEMVL